jgi:hypothetical protein
LTSRSHHLDTFLNQARLSLALAFALLLRLVLDRLLLVVVHYHYISRCPPFDNILDPCTILLLELVLLQLSLGKTFKPNLFGRGR